MNLLLELMFCAVAANGDPGPCRSVVAHMPETALTTFEQCLGAAKPAAQMFLEGHPDLKDHWHWAGARCVGEAKEQESAPEPDEKNHT